MNNVQSMSQWLMIASACSTEVLTICNCNAHTHTESNTKRKKNNLMHPNMEQVKDLVVVVQGPSKTVTPVPRHHHCSPVICCQGSQTRRSSLWQDYYGCDLQSCSSYCYDCPIEGENLTSTLGGNKPNRRNKEWSLL